MTYIEQNIINTYAGLFEKLSALGKIELIERLSISLKKQVSNKEKDFFQSFGAFSDDKSIDDIITEIKESRIFIQKDLDF